MGLANCLGSAFVSLCVCVQGKLKRSDFQSLLAKRTMEN